LRRDRSVVVDLDGPHLVNGDDQRRGLRVLAGLPVDREVGVPIEDDVAFDGEGGGQGLPRPGDWVRERLRARGPGDFQTRPLVVLPDRERPVLILPAVGQRAHVGRGRAKVLGKRLPFLHLRRVLRRVLWFVPVRGRNDRSLFVLVHGLRRPAVG